MPGNRKITAKTIKHKESLHPGSRKAGQLNRVHLRETKLQLHKRNRKNANSTRRELGPSLDTHDERIKELDGERRAGRAKVKEQLELEEQRRREEAEYETGMEVLDLTHPQTAKLLFRLLDSDTPLQPSHVDLCKHIRLFKNSPDEIVVSKPGRTEGMGLLFGDEVGEGEDWTNGEVEERPMDLGA